ncbi:alpha-amylase family glycosyl hydrolase [Chryseobacterium sp.]|uniref:alpha-amylase family glycosyl hydrolase n=1 Tax=Chryseobacterium sp. TaxID=1871047 RepID=UPI0035B3C2E8
MKYIYTLLLVLITNLIGFAQVSWQGGSAPEANQSGTILFDKSGTPLASYTGTIYAHTGVTLDGVTWQKVIGNWGDNTVQPALVPVSGNIYKLDLTPSVKSFYGVTTGNISKINIVLRGASGSPQTSDLELNVGAYQANLTAPLEKSITLLNSGQSLTIKANNTNGNASYTLLANGVSINTYTGSSFSFTDSNILANRSYELQVTQGSQTYSKKFYVLINPGTISQALPTNMENGINYNSTDNTKATLVLEAPGKDFVYVAGSFNNWQPSANYAMKKDPTTGKFWLELSGLTSGTSYSYQYWVADATPLANSPSVVKTADPASTLVLSPSDDPNIPSASYPNIPAYPVDQDREVTVLKTGETPYTWSTNNFTKPNKDKLVIYEVLVRDFDSHRNFQDLIDKIDYFKNLKINAIQLMPVMEFEGNESWGYNTAFHMALDKFYGNKNKLKEFVDLCHQNGIAVILDIAFNHAFGRNPMVRMWMNDPDGDGWGSPSTENPYFNTVAKHTYSVGEDFNHSSTYTKNYVKQTIKYWINEFKIDGFRWDLTKGFTQNCSASDETCTNSYQQDRVDVLKEYADYSWSIDPNHYVIFEHLGTDAEEREWANYKINEGKGIMLWGKMTDEYNELTMGYPNKSIARMTSTSRGFTGKRLIGYAESHDEERLMYKNLQYGNSQGSYNVKNLNTALSRMSALGAVSILVPGPKMIWHFGELGWEKSIFTCTDGTVNTSSDTTSGDCKLSTKPQPQWSGNWLADVNRKKIYDDWAKMITLKNSEPVFSGDVVIANENTVTPNIKITKSDLPSNQLKDVLIISNFGVEAKDVNTGFPYTGTWYNLMDNSSITVTNTTAPITLQPGEFRIFGNQASLIGEKYSFSTKQASCSQDNGEITITVNQSADFIAKIIGTNYNQTYNFTSTKIISNLAAGTYSVCVSTVGNNDEKCYNLVISKEIISEPTGSSSQTFLPGSVIGDLVATGSNIKWYAASSGGSALASTNLLVSGNTYYASQTVNGCESAVRLAVIVTIDYTNFSIEVKSETCTGKNNGEINIVATQSFNYVAKINGKDYGFTNNKLSVTGLSPGTYSVCITIPGKTFEQCYNVTIGKGGSLTGKISTSKNAVSVSINEGTAPYTVFVNGTEKLETTDKEFTVEANQWDLVEVKTAVSCEGVLSKTVTEPVSFGVSAAYPNPTRGEFYISIPDANKEAAVEVYSQEGRLVLKQTLKVISGRIKLDLTNNNDGVYMVRVLLSNPKIIKIIKNH